MGNKADNEDLIVGCVFEFIGSNKENYYESIEYMEVWEVERQEVLDDLFEELNEKAKKSKYKTYFALDYGYSIKVKIIFPEPLDNSNHNIDYFEVKSDVISYYKNELDIILDVVEDMGYILYEDTEFWTLHS